MVDENPTIPPNTVYSPPTAEVVDAFARKVCRQLGSAYTTPEIMDGLSGFVKVAAAIQAKYLTRCQSVEQVDNVESSR